MSIAGITVDEGDDDSGVAVIPVTLSNASGSDVTVDWATTGGTAISGVDYVAASGNLTLSGTKSSAEIQISLIGDQIPEDSSTIEVELSNSTGAVIGNAVATVLIANDDGPIPTLSIADVSVDEGDASTSIGVTVSLDIAATIDMSVDYATVDGTAQEGSDYSSAQGTVTIPAGSVSTDIIIDVIGDEIAELEEQFLVQLSGPSPGLVLGDTEASVTLVNDDGDLPSLSVADASVNESTGNDVQVDVVISLTQASAEIVSVDFATVPGTAEAGADYVARSGTVTFAVGETSHTESFTIIGDTTVEADEIFAIELSNPSPSAAVLADSEGVVTIVSDDTQPSLSISSTSVTEGSTGTIDAELVVSLFEAATETVTVDYATVDASATAGSDYVARSGTITFLAGETTVTETFTVNGDVNVEDTETFTVQLSNPTPASAEITETNGTVTIVSDDATPVLSVADAEVSEGNSGTTTVVVEVSLAEAASEVVTVDYYTLDASASSDSDYTEATGTLTFAVGETVKTVEITVSGDELIEEDEQFAFILGDTTPEVTEVADGMATVTILNDDFPPTVNIADVSINEGNAGISDVNVLLMLSSPAVEPMSVDYASVDGTAVAPEDYVASSGTVNFAIGDTEASVQFSVNGDNVIEPIESFTVVLSNPVIVEVGQGAATVSIINDDSDTYVINAFAGIAGTTANYDVNDEGAPAVSTALDRAYGVAATEDGVVYIADSFAHVIRRVALDGTMTTVAGNGTKGFSGDGGLATSAQLDEPFGIEVDPAGNLYISDTKNNRIRKVDTNGIITTYVGDGSAVDKGDGGPATSASLFRPLRTRWHNGELYVSDNLHAKIKKVDAAGIITTVVGTGTEGYSGDDGLAINARIRKPVGLDFDANGDMFLADRGNHRIRKIDMTTGIITAYAGVGCFNVDNASCGGNNGFSGDGGPIDGDVRFSNVRDVQFDSIGNLFIADNSNRRIRMVDTQGIIDTVAGIGSFSVSGDGGPADEAAIGSPYDIAIDGSNNVYLADDGFFVVRKISPANSVGDP